MTRIHFNWKFKAGIILAIVLISAWLSWQAIKAVNSYFETHYFQYNKVLTVILKPPLQVMKRIPKTEKFVLDYPHEIDTPIKKYICDKFGVWDCKTALAIVDAESHFQEEAIHVNDNGTVDLGCWQINSIHFKAGTITAKDALDCKKATDWAYNKFKADKGWSAWSTFINGSFKDFIE